MIFIILFINFAWSHSWVEQLSVIGRDGLTQGSPGYPRGNGWWPAGLGSTLIIPLTDDSVTFVPNIQ